MTTSSSVPVPALLVSKLAKHPLYKELTVRNHNTAFKLRDLLAD